MTTDLRERYGAPSRWGRRTTVTLAAAVAALGLGWLAWTAWFHSTPEVSSELVSFDVTSDRETAARLTVTLRDGVEASCRLRAYAVDHTTVGELVFAPAPGTNDVVIRTERRATSVEKVGCTAPGQSRPR